MKTTIILKAALLAAAVFALPFAGRAGDVTRCDKVFEEVRAAVEKEPQKVLVIVEDAMVANETCACEIVKAAILGSKANAELTRQIALTATHVAPKMAALIAECAGATTGPLDGGKGVVESVKQSVGVQPPVSDDSSGADSRMTPGDIRGVYLIQPSTGGFTTTPTTTTHTTTKIIVKRTPPRRSIPQSPSSATGT